MSGALLRIVRLFSVLSLVSLAGCGDPLPPRGPNGIKEKAFIGVWREDPSQESGGVLGVMPENAPLRQVSFSEDGKYKMVFVKRDGTPTDTGKFAEGTWSVSGETCTLSITNSTLTGDDKLKTLVVLSAYVYKEKARDEKEHLWMRNEEDQLFAFSRVEK